MWNHTDAIFPSAYSKWIKIPSETYLYPQSFMLVMIISPWTTQYWTVWLKMGGNEKFSLPYVYEIFMKILNFSSYTHHSMNVLTILIPFYVLVDVIHKISSTFLIKFYLKNFPSRLKIFHFNLFDWFPRFFSWIFINF